MKNKEYDLVIAYRTYPGTKFSRTRPILQNDKFKLANLCLKSFIDSLFPLKYKMLALLDSCPPEWEDLFNKYIDKDALEIINLNSAGEYRSFNTAINLLLKQKYSDLVYMAEDDYFYLPNQFEKMVKFLKADPEVDFVTPYDHLDYYTYDFHDYNSKIKIFGDKHWRNVNSTCMTYLTTKKNLYQSKDVLLSCIKNNNNPFPRYKFLNRFFKGSADADIFLSLTKINVFKLFKILRYLYQDREIFNLFFKAWICNWKQILFGKRWKLWCPIPSIATHMEQKFLAPTIDWDEIFQKEMKK